jgi:O-methyltransferase domain
MFEPAAMDQLPEEWLLLLPLVWGYRTSALISTALHFGLADRLGDGTRTSEELAAETGAHGPTLTRLLRALSSIGITKEVEPGRFALTPVGAPLRTDGPYSVHSSAKMFCDESMLRAWEGLNYSVRTGKPAFDQAFGTDYFTHVAQSPELSKHVNEAMSQTAQIVAAGIIREYDFSPFHTVVDVGGGDGTLLAAIMSATPRLRGIVYDSPTGVDAAPSTLKAAGVADRCQVHTGDFFTSVPDGGDLYLLKSVIHDWDNERSTTILGNCRRAMPASGRLLLAEHVLPPQVDPSTPPFSDLNGAFTYLSDINMLVNLGGQERTEAEFRALLSDAGFRMTAVTHVSGLVKMSLIEASPA